MPPLATGATHPVLSLRLNYVQVSRTISWSLSTPHPSLAFFSLVLPAAMDEARALLEQLMGRERDVPVDKRTNRTRKVWDDDICKPYLCGEWYLRLSGWCPWHMVRKKRRTACVCKKIRKSHMETSPHIRGGTPPTSQRYSIQ